MSDRTVGWMRRNYCRLLLVRETVESAPEQQQKHWLASLVRPVIDTATSALLSLSLPRKRWGLHSLRDSSSLPFVCRVPWANRETLWGFFCFVVVFVSSSNDLSLFVYSLCREPTFLVFLVFCYILGFVHQSYHRLFRGESRSVPWRAAHGI